MNSDSEIYAATMVRQYLLMAGQAMLNKSQPQPTYPIDNSSYKNLLTSQMSLNGKHTYHLYCYLIRAW